jgi:hypothetical protein
MLLQRKEVDLKTMKSKEITFEEEQSLPLEEKKESGSKKKD